MPTSDPAPDAVQSELTAVLDPDPDNFTPSPTSPLCLGKNCTTQELPSPPVISNLTSHLCCCGVLRSHSALQCIYILLFFWSDLVSTVEGLDSLGLTNSGPGFFPALQRQMESQLLADPEMMRRVLGSPFVQSTLSTSSPQLTRQLILSNPQIQQLLQTNPEVGDMLNSTDVIAQVGMCASVCWRYRFVASGLVCQSTVTCVPPLYCVHAKTHHCTKLLLMSLW